MQRHTRTHIQEFHYNLKLEGIMYMERTYIVENNTNKTKQSKNIPIAILSGNKSLPMMLLSVFTVFYLLLGLGLTLKSGLFPRWDSYEEN